MEVFIVYYDNGYHVEKASTEDKTFRIWRNILFYKNRTFSADSIFLTEEAANNYIKKSYVPDELRYTSESC